MVSLLACVVTPRPKSAVDETCGRPALPGLRVCAACQQHARLILAGLPKLYLAAETALVRPPSPMVTERISGSRYQGLPINEAAATARTDLLHLTATWAGLVVDEFGLAAPARRTVDELVIFLARHLKRILAHPAAADFIAEIDGVSRAASRAANDGQTRPVEVGVCPHSGCGRRVTVRFRAQATTPSLVGCDAGHCWPARQWLLLAHQLDRTGRHGREPAASGTGKDRG